jgi:hypothetical protein
MSQVLAEPLQRARKTYALQGGHNLARVSNRASAAFVKESKKSLQRIEP